MAGPAEEVFSDRYQPVRLIARGGMAEVWLAHDGLLDRVVALKVLFPELSVDKTFVERFRREAQAAARLSHPHIVSVYDWGEAPGSYFIVMEYVDGRPLSALLRVEGPLLADRAATIGADVAAALGYAHRNGVIHRDVKPGNVLIAADDQIKVTDFGIARAANTTENLTQTGAVMGTATYFSPEQALGLAVDQRSDVYALGVVLYEMVAGRPPFVADGPVAVAYKHVHEEPLPPTAIVPELPEAFENVVMQALAKDVADRYASAEELRADLMRFRQGRPVLAEPPVTTLGRHTLGAVSARSTLGGGSPPGERAGVPRSGGAAAAAAGGAAALAGGAAALAGTAGGAAAAGTGAAVGRGGGAGPAVGGAVGVSAGAAAGGGIDAGAIGPGPVTAGQPPGRRPRPGAAVPGAGATQALPILDRTPYPSDGAGLDTPTDDRPQSLRVYLILLVILAVALALMVFLLNRQLDLFGTTSTPTATKTPATVPIVVPADLGGKSYTDALTEAQHLGMSVTRVDISDAQVPLNHVIGTKPAAGQQVPPGTTLEIDVSSGAAPLTLPDVVGEDAQSATQQIQQAGFTVGPQQAQSSGTIRSGTVITTNPPPGYQGHAGDAITLVVSSGPGQVAIPNEAGKSQAAATSDLTQAGFRVVSGPSVGSISVPAGSVVQTNPPAGTTVLQGTAVALDISSGPAKVRVPYVLNYSESNARTDIQNRGLVVAEVVQAVSDPSQDGVVLNQSPGAGVTVDQGSTVTLTIGQYQGTTASTA